MRRTTSALTTTILGAVLSASTVSAQQSLPSASARRAGTAATATAPASGPDAAVEDPSFGMAAARGPHYLLRNGLDYIDYQEYERALKYLREAEKRQAELPSSDKLKLKQAIERAQRGLRESIGSEAPYALSSRTTRPSGVVAAASDARVAVAAPATSRTTKSVRREGDDRGDPIRLAGGEAPADGADEASALADARAGLPAVPGGGGLLPDEPSLLPEIPQQPEMPQLDVADPRDEAPIARAADAPTAPTVSRISPGDAKAAPAPLVVNAAVAAQADLSTPFPELDAAEPVSAPALESPTPTLVDESLKLSTTAAPSAPAPITLETPAEAALTQPAPVSAPAPAPAPVEVEPMALPPLGADSLPAPALEADAPPAAEPVAPRVAVAPAAADLDLPALPSDLRGRGLDSGFPTLPAEAAEQPLPDEAEELPPLPGGPSGGPADEAPSVAPPAGSLDRRAEAVPAEPEPEPEAEPVLVEVPVQEPAVESFLAPAQDAPEAAPVAAPAQDEAEPVQETPAPAAAPAFDPAQEAVAPRAAAPATRNHGALERSESLLPPRAAPVSTLTPELQNRVEEVARRLKTEEEQYRISQSQPRPAAPPPPAAGGAYDPATDLRSQTQIDISRAPSPAEARPIRAIPVPEDWVPLGTREWSSQRKYWAASATCHLPLYFQDPMLERYGHSVENFLGPKGRFLAYPVDKHTQSTQRNQIAQPFFSMGLFAGQILALPYNMIMDPPWEAQYDLGYWRPGDKIPTDMYYLPTHGTGPPLRGRQY